MFSAEKILVEIDNMVLDVIRRVNPFPIIHFNSIDLIPSPSIESCSVEEFSISISISKPVDSGFESPEVLLMPENIAKLFGEIFLKIVEAGTGEVTK